MKWPKKEDSTRRVLKTLDMKFGYQKHLPSMNLNPFLKVSYQTCHLKWLLTTNLPYYNKKQAIK